MRPLLQCPNCRQDVTASIDSVVEKGRLGHRTRVIFAPRIADLWSRKLDPPLDRMATAISKDATILQNAVFTQLHDMQCK